MGGCVTLDGARKITISTQAWMKSDVARQRASARRKIRVKPRQPIGYQWPADTDTRMPHCDLGEPVRMSGPNSTENAMAPNRVKCFKQDESIKRRPGQPMAVVQAQ